MAKRNSKRRSWTASEVRELKSAARKKTPARKIARNLKRSEGATRQKAFSIGLSLDSARLKSDAKGRIDTLSEFLKKMRSVQ